MVRAKVDSLVADKVEPVKRRLPRCRAEATRRVQAENSGSTRWKSGSTAELKRLTGGLVPGIELPKIKL